jgi:hypothetical protein
MLLVHPHIQPLQIAHAGADVRDFVNRKGFPPCGAAGQHCHQREQYSYRCENWSGLLCHLISE